MAAILTCDILRDDVTCAYVVVGGVIATLLGNHDVIVSIVTSLINTEASSFIAELHQNLLLKHSIVKLHILKVQMMRNSARRSNRERTALFYDIEDGAKHCSNML